MRGSYSRMKPRRGPQPVKPGRAPAPAPRPARVLQPWAVPAVTTFYVHAHGPTVRDNKASGLNRSLVLIRRSDRLNEMVIVRHVELTGPSKLVHRHSMPLPATENNAIAVMETTSAVVAYFDPPGSQIEYATDVPIESCAKVTLTDEEWAKRAVPATHQIRR